MSIDSVGGFAGNKSTKRFMHILVDHFSRHAWISTTRTQCSRDFIQLIDPIAKKNKIKIILADKYAGINSEKLKTYLKNMDIQLIFTCIDCPSSNGLNERLNQTLVNRIRCKINGGDKRAWSKIAQDCVKDYNRTIHSSTKFEPAYLLYGKQSSISPVDSQMKNDLDEDKKKAFINSTNSFEANKRRVDKSRVVHDFEIGDLVYVENGNKLNRKKTDKIRVGPFQILEKISPLFYKVDSGKRKYEANYYHSNKLSPFYQKKVLGEGEM